MPYRIVGQINSFYGPTLYRESQRCMQRHNPHELGGSIGFYRSGHLDSLYNVGVTCLRLDQPAESHPALASNPGPLQEPKHSLYWVGGEVGWETRVVNPI